MYVTPWPVDAGTAKTARVKSAVQVTCDEDARAFDDQRMRPVRGFPRTDDLLLHYRHACRVYYYARSLVRNVIDCIASNGTRAAHLEPVTSVVLVVKQKYNNNVYLHITVGVSRKNDPRRVR